MLKQLPRDTFERAVAEHEADKHCNGFSRWPQLQTMVCAQLSGATSVRTLEADFNTQASHHYHLDAVAIKGSTLADASRRAPAEVFAEVAENLTAGMQRKVRRDVQRLLDLLGSTSITLKRRDFDAWTFDSRTCHTQGLKLHVMYANEQD